ncbi:hypothetical protein IDJ77_10795 [Mucilaginibacter sp. ZT4R22]|uniref:Nuclear transport factor 2 family protein n=1 Tax=Mucilaginibacter pankratovii TaxID=2772110 RepID=A0ABR7WQ24_9SPHI|nr:hypothetical protein [Mucilaginibacter pankratovii]MBD1364296.1 hypothetical protein [Mucilaginibacter pankratovii]
METNAIDLLTYELYHTLSFRNAKPPKLAELRKFFYGGGVLINNSFTTPIAFTAASYLKALESQIAIGDLKQFLQREISSKTEIFDKIAQRTSVYEYSFAEIPPRKMPRGVSYMQFVKEGEAWLISSIAWNDENENHRIPEKLVD